MSVQTPIAPTYTPEYIDNDPSLDDWWTYEVNVYYCQGCSMGFRWPHYERKVLVWPSKNDKLLCKIINDVRNDGVKRLVMYEQNMGPAMSFYALTEEE